MDTSVYFGVDCRQCDHRIALVEVISGPRMYQWLIPHISQFEVQCPSCGTSKTYSYRHVIVFETATLKNFDAHPAFQSV